MGAVVFAVGAGFLPFVAQGRAVVGRRSQPSSHSSRARRCVVVGTVARVRGRTRIRRIGAVVGSIVIVALVAFVVGPAVAATNVPRPAVAATPDSRGLGYSSVTLTTADDVDLAGWYVPSRNRAAVVLLHGAGSTRSNVLDEAAVLASNGFGVLMIDARGHGESGGRAMDFGWHGDADIAAATAFLAERDDVDPGRIGVVGSSMGGEEAIGASGSNVHHPSGGRGRRNRTRRRPTRAGCPMRSDVRGLVQEQLEVLQDWVTDALTDASPPTAMRDSVSRSGDTRYLLVTAGEVATEAHAAAYISSAAPDRVEIWNVEGAGHTDGLGTAPDEWEVRVIGFLVPRPRSALRSSDRTHFAQCPVGSESMDRGDAWPSAKPTSRGCSPSSTADDRHGSTANSALARPRRRTGPGHDDLRSLRR